MPLSAAFSLALSVLWLYATQETSSGHSFPRTSYMKCLSIARNQRETFALGTSPPKERRRIRHSRNISVLHGGFTERSIRVS